jgi:glycosyltransferase involved in cell wall biosynthesis
MLDGDKSVNTTGDFSKKCPLVSVIMPVYNQEPYVADAINSVIEQTYENFEIIISDDCSQDQTSIIVKRYAEKFRDKIKLYRLTNKNMGGAAHFAALFTKCKGDYVCIFSGDDIMYPDKIKRQIEEMLKYKLTFHGHAVDCIDESGNIIGEIQSQESKFYGKNYGLIMGGIKSAAASWMIKKTHAHLDPRVGFLHDFDTGIRAIRNDGQGYISKDKLGSYRIVSKSWSRNLSWRNYVDGYSNLLKSWIRSEMYLESIILFLKLLILAPHQLIKFFNSK